MKKELITCPSCGAQMEDSQLFEIECPYCGSKLKNTHLYEVDEIVFCNISEEEAKQKMAWELVQDDSTPLNLYNTLSFKATKVYVPLWHLGGSYNASWSCERIEYKDEIYTDKDGRVQTRRSQFPEHIPMNGNAQGAFEILISASKQFPYSLDFPKYSSKAYKEELIDKEAYIYNMDIEKREAWKLKSVGNCIDEVIGTHLSHQLPYAYDNLYYNSSYKRSINRSILFPFWILEYEYKGEKYTCSLRGDNGELVSIEQPSEEEKYQLINESVKDPISLTIFKCVCILLSIISIVFVIKGRGGDISKVSLPFLFLPLIFWILLDNFKKREYDLIDQCIDCQEKANGDNIRNTKSQAIVGSGNPLLDYSLKQLKELGNTKSDNNIHNLQQAIYKYHEKLAIDKIWRLIFYIILIIAFALMTIFYINNKDKKYNIVQQLNIETKSTVPQSSELFSLNCIDLGGKLKIRK